MLNKMKSALGGKKTTISILATVLISVFIATGIIYAASHNVTSTLGGESGDFFDVDGTMIFDSIKVGAQGTGGVTFFNGTIVNDTTTDEADNPVTFGDNVRIDGRVYRGATAGTSDSMPFIINDNVEIAGDLTVSSLTGTGIVSSTNIADDAVTQLAESTGTVAQTTITNPNDYDLLTTEVDITTEGGALLIMFSGVLSNDVNGGTGRVFLVLDDEIVTHTIRRGISVIGGFTFSLSFTNIASVEAGNHTVQIGFTTAEVGSTLSVFNNTLDVVELKK